MFKHKYNSTTFHYWLKTIILELPREHKCSDCKEVHTTQSKEGQHNQTIIHFKLSVIPCQILKEQCIISKSSSSVRKKMSFSFQKVKKKACKLFNPSKLGYDSVRLKIIPSCHI